DCEGRRDEEQKTSQRRKHRPSPIPRLLSGAEYLLFRSLRAPRCTKPKGAIGAAPLQACAELTFTYIRNPESGGYAKTDIHTDAKWRHRSDFNMIMPRTTENDGKI